MNVPQINEVKEALEKLQTQGAIKEWELPYENLLTRLSAAIFFVEPIDSSTDLEKAWKALSKYEHFSFRENAEKKISQLTYRVTFSEEEFNKNNPKEVDDQSETNESGIDTATAEVNNSN